MWWFKSKQNYNNEAGVFMYIKNTFDNMHKKVLAEANDYTQEQRNIVEKNLYLSIVDELIKKYSVKINKSELETYRKNILIFLEKCWLEAEPDKVVSLLK